MREVARDSAGGFGGVRVNSGRRWKMTGGSRTSAAEGGGRAELGRNGEMGRGMQVGRVKARAELGRLCCCGWLLSGRKEEE